MRYIIAGEIRNDCRDRVVNLLHLDVIRNVETDKQEN